MAIAPNAHHTAQGDETRQQQPSVAAVQTHTIPEEMKQAARWVVWRYEPNKDKPGWTKVPYNARNGRRGSSTGPSTWSVFQAAVDAYEHRGYDGLGFVSGDGWTLLDLDHAIDSESGDPKLWARHIIDHIDSYSELSPSGTGIRIVTHANCPGEEKRTDYRDGRVEIYAADQFLTITGHHLEGTPATVEKRSEQVKDVHQHVFAEKREKKAKAGVHKVQNSRTSAAASSMNDLDLIEFGKRQKDGGKFARLWGGDISGYPSHSEADQALVNKLVFLGIEDPERIDAAFRESGLMREKWERDDYRAQTIENAILTVSERYQPGAKASRDGCQLDTPQNDLSEQTTSGATAPKIENEAIAADDSKEVARLKAIINKQTARIRELEQELAWHKRTMSNQHISAANRIILTHVNEVTKKAPASDGQAPRIALHLPTVAKACGMSVRSVSTGLKDLDKTGALRKLVEPVISQSGENKGKLVTRVFVQPDLEMLARPEKIKPEVPRNHGGNRVCPECGSRHIKRKAVYTCLECEHKWESAEHYLRSGEESWSQGEPEEIFSEIAAPPLCDSKESANFVPPREPAPSETFEPEPCYRCHQTAQSWRGDRWECDVCHPPCSSQRQEAG